MDVFEFIESAAIREHLKAINYPFTATEKAFLVFQAENAPLQKKHEAYRAIIAEETDEKVEKRPNTEEYPSLFGLLRRYMEIENEIVAEFYHTKNAVFRYRYACGNDESYCEDYETVYPTLALCEEACREDLAEYDYDVGLRFYEMRIDSLDTIGKRIELKFSPTGEIVSIDASMLDEEQSEVLRALDGMWFAFPTPFKRGDILIPQYRRYHLYPKGTPVVVTSLGTWCGQDYLEKGYNGREINLAQKDRLYEWHRVNADSSDMTVRGYFSCEDGSYYYEVAHDLLHHDYYTEPLERGYRILRVLSDFEKGELDHEALTKLAQYIQTEERLREDRRYIHINDEYQKSLGL